MSPRPSRPLILGASLVSAGALLAAAAVLGRDVTVQDEVRVARASSEAEAAIQEEWVRWLRATEGLPGATSWTGTPAPPPTQPRDLLEAVSAPDVFDVVLAEARALEAADPTGALERLLEGIRESTREPHRLAEGRLRALQLAANLEREAIVVDQWRALEAGLSFEDARGDTAYRLLATLSAARFLEGQERDTAVLDLTAAWGDARLALPVPRWVLDEEQLDFSGDPWREELRLRLAQVAASGSTGETVARALERCRVAEQLAALEELLGRSLPSGSGTWHFEALVPGDLWVAGRADGTAPLRTALLRSTDLLDAFEGHLELPGGFLLDVHNSGQRPLLRTVELAGVGAEPLVVSLRHPDPRRLASEARTQRNVLRAGLAALALFSLVAGVATTRALARERELAELRTRFVASVSHDLRTPLASILLTAENLEAGRVRSEERRAQYYTAIRGEATRLARLVEDVLDFSRIERGEGARVQRQPTRLGPMLDQLELEFGSRCERAGVELVVQRGEFDSEGTLDVELVLRCASNLLENALRHAETPRITLASEAHAGALCLEVIDEGVGIPANRREGLFEPYRRGPDSSNGQARGGTGLGLSIVRELARAHGGSARLEDGPTGKGVRAKVWFSMDEGQHPGGAPR